VGELHEFYERYIAAFNAGDTAAYAACFHPPVTMMGPERPGQPTDRMVRIVEDPGAFALQMPAHWSHSSIDSVIALDDVAPFEILPGLPEPKARRLGIIGTASRWDRDGNCYEQVQALYLLSRRDGRLGITFIADLGFTRRKSQAPASTS
jgi:hypothetical protein